MFSRWRAWRENRAALRANDERETDSNVEWLRSMMVPDDTPVITVADQMTERAAMAIADLILHDAALRGENE